MWHSYFKISYLILNMLTLWLQPTPAGEAARSKAWVCGRSIAGIACSNPAGSLSLVRVVYRQIEVSESGWSLVQRNSTECGTSECDRGASTMRRPRPTRCHRTRNKLYQITLHVKEFTALIILCLHLFVLFCRKFQSSNVFHLFYAPQLHSCNTTRHWIK